MKSIFLSFLFLIVFQNSVFAQNPQLKKDWDSLRTLTRQAFYHEKQDSANFFAQKMYALAVSSRNDSLKLIALGIRGITESEPSTITRVLKESLRLADSLGYFWQKVEVMSTLSIHYMNIGNVKESYLNTRRLMALADSSGSNNTREEALMNMSNVYLEIQDYPKAIQYLKKFYASLNGPSDQPRDSMLTHLRKAEILIGIGKNYKLINQFDSSYYYINAGISYAKSHNIPAAVLRGFLDLAGYYNAIKIEDSEAIKSMKACLDSAATYLAFGDQSHLAVYNGHVAMLLFKEKKYGPCVDSLNALLPQAIALGDLVNQRKYYDILYQCYDHLGKHEAAFESLKKFQSLSDSLNNKQIAEQLGIYEIERGLKDKELENLKLQQKADADAQKLRFFMIGLIAACILGLLSILYARHRQLAANRINNLNQKLNQTLQELNESMVAKRNLVNFLAHDLRTPLQIIRINARILEHGNKSKEASQISASAEQVNKMAEQIVEVENLKTGDVTPNISEVSLSDVVSQVVSQFEILASAKHVQINLSLPFEVNMIKTDGELIQKIIGNLLSNAIKATPENSFVGISVRKNGQMAVIGISDEGSGIDPDIAQDLLSKPVKSRLDKGLGIGLYLCNQYLQLLKGELTFQNNPSGKGAHFEMRLPMEA